MKITSYGGEENFLVDREFAEAAQSALNFACDRTEATPDFDPIWGEARNAATDALRVYGPLGATEQLIVDRITEAVSSYGSPVGPRESGIVSAFCESLLIMRGEIGPLSSPAEHAKALDELRAELTHRGVKLR